MREVKPPSIRLEASSICQLRCPSCPTTTGAAGAVVGSGFLKLGDFKKLVDENPWLERIELSNWGEIFLNPHLLDIIAYAHEKNVALEAMNGVNLNHAKDEVLEALVKYGFRGLLCSIDGASAGTYELYRKRGNFDRVIENIKKINLYKEQYQSSLPLLKWQFVVFGHNEHEIPEARKLAEELNMEFETKLAWNQIDSPVGDKEFIRRETGLPYATEDEYRETHGVLYSRQICTQLWNLPQINWDGKVLGCCVNYWGDFGENAFEGGLLKSINSEKMRYAREMLLGKREPREGIPCTTCDKYLSMKEENNWLTLDEIRENIERWVVKPHPSVEFVGREGQSVLFHKQSGRTFLLDETGRILWGLIDGRRPVRRLLKLLARRCGALNLDLAYGMIRELERAAFITFASGERRIKVPD